MELTREELKEMYDHENQQPLVIEGHVNLNNFQAHKELQSRPFGPVPVCWTKKFQDKWWVASKGVYEKKRVYSNEKNARLLNPVTQ